MMGMKQITYTVNSDGSVEVEISGAVGKECVDLTKDILEKLGDVKSFKEKPEYYLKAPVQNKNHVKNG